MTTELGEAFYAELLWVHGMLRQELELVRSLAARVADGLPAEELRVQVAVLKANAADADIAPVVDRLEADHRVVAAQLDEIEAAVAAEDQARVIAALDALADHLLEHLSFEEESIGPTLRRMDRHPLWS